jgi:hypothetical protein
MIVGLKNVWTWAATTPTDFTNERSDQTTGGPNWTGDDGLLATAGATGVLNVSGGAVWGATLVALEPHVPAVIIQEGYRFRDDDGDEDAASWLAVQDTDIDIAPETPFRLRTLVDTADEPSSNQYQLEYKKSTDTLYQKIIDTAAQIPTFVSAGAASGGTGNSTPGLPAGWQEGDLFILLVQSENQTGSAPSGWTAIADSPQGTGTAGNAASTAIEAYWAYAYFNNVAPTVTDRGDHTYSVILCFRNTDLSSNPFDVTSGGVETPADTSLSITGDTTTVNNCLIVAVAAHDIDTNTSNQFSSWSNTDLSNLLVAFDGATNQGDGGGIGVVYGGKATAGAYGATTATVASSLKAFMTFAIKPRISAIPSPAFVAAGSQTVGTGDISVTPPTTQEHDLMLLFVESANQPGADPSGWTAVTGAQQGTGTGGAAAAVALEVFWRRASASEGNVTVTDRGDHTLGVILTFRGVVRNGLPYDVVSGTTQSSTASAVIPGATTTVDNTMVVLAIARDNDAAANATSAWTNSDLADLPAGFKKYDNGTTTGQGGGLAINTGFKQSAGAYGSTAVTMTNATIMANASLALKPAEAVVQLSPSSNIAASGEATTAQLTAPSGKTTGDFDAGRIQDDENPSDLVAISDDDYTELEWSLTTTAVALDTETYQFRVTNIGVAFDTYSVTPAITIDSGGGDLVVNVSDGITLTESRTLLIPELFINKSDSITVTESVNRMAENRINVSDTATITENVQRMVENRVAVSDSATVSESVQRMAENRIVVSDTIAATDSPALLVPDLYVSRSDSVTISEALQLLHQSFIAVSDSITISEALQRLVEGRIAVSDSVSLTEAWALMLESYVNKSDSTTVTESMNVTIAASTDYSINVSDTATASESLKFGTENRVAASDSATVSESRQLEVNNFINRSETITVTESATVSITAVNDLTISVSDNATVTDTPAALIPVLLLAVSDSATVTENVQRMVESYISTNDSLTVTEALQRLLEGFVRVSDSSSVSEALLRLVESYVTVSDTATISENVSVSVTGGIVTPAISVSDTVTTAAAVQLLVSVALTVSDSLTASEVVQLEKVSFVNKSDSITVSESVQRLLESNVNKSDTATITEAVTVFRTSHNVETSDTATITESVNLRITELFLTVSDTTTLTEALELDTNNSGAIWRPDQTVPGTITGGQDATDVIWNPDDVDAGTYSGGDDSVQISWTPGN